MRYISVTSLGKPATMQLANGPSPACGADEVLIKTAFIGVGGIDAIMRRGDLGEANPQPPFTPGLEVSGEIIEVGSDVTDFSVGDKVAALLLLKMGGYSEVVACNASSVVALPKEVAPVYGASLVNPTTAVVALSIVQPQSNESLVITGAAGGLASAIGQVAKAMHPKTNIIGVVRSKDQANSYPGFDTILDTDEFTASIENGTQYNAVMDPVGGDLRRAIVEGLSPRGRMLLLGNVSGDTASNISSQTIWLKSLQVSGLNLGYLNSVDPLTVKTAAQEAVSLIASGKVDLAPVKTFAFEDVVQAHEYLESGKNHGRIVLGL